MSKKFTSKPIRERGKDKKNEAEEELVDLYKDTQSFSKMQKPIASSGVWVLVVLLSILFGFGASMAYDFYFDSQEVVNGQQKVIIDKQEEVTVLSEDRLAEVSSRIDPVIVNFYDNSVDVNGPFYQDMYSFGSGFILTSDGWIATTKSVIEKIGDKDYVVLTADYQVFQVEKVLKDSISPIVFVKVKAFNLPVVELGEVSSLNLGQEVYSFLASYPKPRIASLHIADVRTTDLEDVVASTEQFNHFISCREGYNQSLLGAPIVNLSGQIVAIIFNNQLAMPVEYLDGAIDDLGKEAVRRAYLGVRYINLAQYPRVDIDGGSMRDKGALLSGWRDLTAVERNSPADKAGFRVGDIVTMVEDELVNGRKNLTEIIQDYDPGQSLRITVLRGDKEQVIEVELGVYD